MPIYTFPVLFKPFVKKNYPLLKTLVSRLTSIRSQAGNLSRSRPAHHPEEQNPDNIKNILNQTLNEKLNSKTSLKCLILNFSAKVCSLFCWVAAAGPKLK